MPKKPTPSPLPEELLTYEEAAALLKLSAIAVKRLCDRRVLEYYMVSGKRRLDAAFVREWRARKRHATREELT